MSEEHPTDTKISDLYQTLEVKCIEVFREFHSQAADNADEKDASVIQFNAVVKAATELLLDFDHEVKKLKTSQKKEEIPNGVNVAIIWAACVAHICTNQIVQLIGGPEGSKLESLTVVNLLDVIAWVEYFREFMEKRFSSIIVMKAKKAYFDEKPEFFKVDDEERKIELEETTKDVLAWSTNMLWEVHRMIQDEFLLQTRSQLDKFFTKIYYVEHERYQTNDNQMITSLCENIFSFVTLHIRTIQERLSDNSDALIMASCLIFSQLRLKQACYRDRFLKSFESCCAAANDFQRMSQQCERIISKLKSSCTDKSHKKMLDESRDTLVSLYSGDAVFAAQKTQYYIFQPIWANIAKDYFGLKWETELTYNELTRKVVRTMDDFVTDLETFLDKFLFQKAISSLIKASVLFYLQILLRKADVARNKSKVFGNNSVALERLGNDIIVLREYFESFATNMPVLQTTIEKEFQLLTIIQELLRIAADISDADPSNYIIVLNKTVKDINLTRSIVKDVWRLVNPSEGKKASKLTKSMSFTLFIVGQPGDVIIHTDQDRLIHAELHLGNILFQHYKRSRKKRPMKAINAQQIRCDKPSVRQY